MRTQSTIKLSRTYLAHSAVPSLTAVDPEIFRLTYAGKCMETDCSDWCCKHGADADVAIINQIQRHIGGTNDSFGEMHVDPEFLGGGYRRTLCDERGCVFLKESERGCDLHARDADCYRFKPMVCMLFPCTFDDGVLHASDEAHDGTLVCLGQGTTLYRGVRDALEYYFGAELVAELDACEIRS